MPRPCLQILSVPLRLAGAAALLALAATAAWAQPYRYVDENGVVGYSQTPPSGGAGEQVRIEAGPSEAETAAALERLRSRIEEDFDQRREAAKAAAEQAEAKAAAAQRAEGCAAARQNLQTLENLGARMLRLPDGSVTRVGEDERAAMIDEARRQITELCD